MNKELQDLAWSCLPKEFKEEVKKLHQKYRECRKECEAHLRKGGKNAMAKIICMNTLFGYHNLTSDAEGEVMLTVPRKKVQEKWQRAYEQEAKYSKAEQNPTTREELYYNRGIMSVIDTLFGSKCLPDETLSQNPTENCDTDDHISTGCDKPAEPKFTRGDMVHCKSFGYEGDYKVLEYTGGPRNCYDCIDKYGAYYRFYESDLESYTEPNLDKSASTYTDDCSSQQFDTIIKDGFSKERRLNFAVQMAQAILTRVDDTPQVIAEAAFRHADALIAECEKKGEKA